MLEAIEVIQAIRRGDTCHRVAPVPVRLRAPERVRYETTRLLLLANDLRCPA